MLLLMMFLHPVVFYDPNNIFDKRGMTPGFQGGRLASELVRSTFLAGFLSKWFRS